LEEESKVKKTVSYSEAFKKQVVDEIARGKFSSAHQAAKGYGIRGGNTVRQWLRKYGRDDLFPQRIRIETMKERDELKEAKKRNRELEAALVNAHMDVHLEHAFLEIACEKLGIQPEELKKKSGLTLSDALKRRGERKI
jgi:transposase-like protein